MKDLEKLIEMSVNPKIEVIKFLKRVQSGLPYEIWNAMDNPDAVHMATSSDQGIRYKITVEVGRGYDGQLLRIDMAGLIAGALGDLRSEQNANRLQTQLARRMVARKRMLCIP